MFRLKRSSAKRASKRRLYVLAFTIPLLVILVPIVYFSLQHAAHTEAVWYNDSWAYRVKVPVTAHTNPETNVYFTKTIDTSDTNKFQTDCGDLRFTDANGKTLQYYIASGCGTSSTVVHVLVPSFPAGASEYYYYFGNPNAINGFSGNDFTAGNLITVGSVGSEEKGTGAFSYWSLDDGTGQTIQNNSLPSNTMTLGASTSSASDDPVWKTDDSCVSGKCLYFDGSNDYAFDSSGINLSGGSFSTSLWIKPTEIGTDRAVFGQGTQTTYQGFLFALLSTNVARFSFWGDDVDTTMTFSQNVWYFVTLTYDATTNTQSIYVNGTLAATDTSASDYSGTGAFCVAGGCGPWSTNYFGGYVDELKVYKYALTPAQVKANYNSRGGNEGTSVAVGGTNQKSLSDGLIGYWKMDESSGNAADTSGNGYTLTNNGTIPFNAGKFGNAPTFNGSSTYFSTASTISGVKSVAFWTKSPATTNVFINLNGSTYITAFNGSVSGIGFTGASVYVNGVLNAALTAGVWNHIVVTSTAGISATAFEVGRSSSYASNTTQIDDVKLYTRTLSGQEARQLSQFAPGPVGYWKMDEKTGTTANDTSGNGNTGTLTNGPTWVSGKVGTAVSFDGINDYITIPDSTSLSVGKTTDNYTLEAWAIVTNSGGWVVEKGQQAYGDGNISYAINVNASQQATFEIMDGTNHPIAGASAATVLSSGVWYHLAGVRDTVTDKLYLYINGVLAASTTDTTTATVVTTQTMAIGNNGSGHTEALTGTVDEVKLYNYARTQPQIIEDMNGGHPIGGSPVGSYVSYWRMDEANGTTAHDNNGSNGNDLTLSSSSWTTSGKINTAWNGTGSVWLSRADDDDFDLASSDDASISMWVKSTSATNPAATEYLFAKGRGTPPGYALYFNTSGFLCLSVDDDTTWTPDDSACTTNDYYDGTWHHIVAEKTGTSEIRVYLDGRSVASDVSIAATGTLASTGSLYVGDDDGDATNSFAGTIDEVKFYRSALTTDQIALDMNANATQNFGSTAAAESAQMTDGTGTAPIGYWPLDEKTGSSANDKSGNGNTGTLNNTPAWVSGCKVGACVYFTSSSSQDITVASTPSSVKSISFWAKPTSTTASFLQLQASGAVAITASSGTLSATGFTSPTIYVNGVVSSTIAANTWQYITVTSATGVNATQLKFGHVNTTYYDGNLDDIKMYNYTRTPAQVAYDFNRGGPIGYWRFDECQGTTAYDSSGNGNNATLTVSGGTYTQPGTCNSGTSSDSWYAGASGKMNGSFAMDTTDTVSIGNVSMYNFDRTSSFSTSIWMKTSTTQSASLLSKQESSGNFRGWNIQTDNLGHIFFQFTNTYSSNLIEAQTANSLNFTDGNWHHVVTTYNGSSSFAGVAIYYDGKLQPLVNNFDTLSATTVNSTPVYVGSRSSTDLLYTGQVDDARIYNYALSQSQVNKLYNGGASVNFGPASGQP